MTDLTHWQGHAFRTEFIEGDMPHRHNGYPAVVRSVKGSDIQYVAHSSRAMTLATMDAGSFATTFYPDFRGQAGLGNVQEIIQKSSDMEQVSKDGLSWCQMKVNQRLSSEPQKIVLPSGKVSQYKVYADWNNNTCIELHRENGFIFFVSLIPGKKMEKQSLAVREFEGDWKPVNSYQPAKAARFYLDWIEIGAVSAEKSVLKYLKAIINPTEENMTEETETKKTKKPAKAKAAKKAPKAKGEKKAKGGSREGSAAATFKELILKGTLTDDQIFAQAQKKHGLDDSKRSYVAWYRNNLRKSGVKVPEAKKAA